MIYIQSTNKRKRLVAMLFSIYSTHKYTQNHRMSQPVRCAHFIISFCHLLLLYSCTYFFSQCILTPYNKTKCKWMRKLSIFIKKNVSIDSFFLQCISHIFHSFNSKKYFDFHSLHLSFLCTFPSSLLHIIRIENYSVTNNVHLHLLFIALYGFYLRNFSFYF